MDKQENTHKHRLRNKRDQAERDAETYDFARGAAETQLTKAFLLLATNNLTISSQLAHTRRALPTHQLQQKAAVLLRRRPRTQPPVAIVRKQFRPSDDGQFFQGFFFLSFFEQKKRPAAALFPSLLIPSSRKFLLHNTLAKVVPRRNDTHVGPRSVTILRKRKRNCDLSKFSLPRKKKRKTTTKAWKVSKCRWSLW